jgi:putative hydrolase of the HAD superfamily
MSAVEAVLIDALGTLVELRPPAPRLRAILADEGFDVTEEQATAGFRAEIGYYLEHHLEGADPDSLEDLRDRCAGVLMDALALPDLDRAVARRALLGALAFEPYPDAVPALRDLRSRGLRLVIASNWDCSLSDWLAPLGLLDLVDGVVTSADAHAAKPAPAAFAAALEIAGVGPDEAVHVGDSVENDIEGARAAGIRALLVWRDGGAPPAGVEAVRSLTEVGALL